MQRMRLTVPALAAVLVAALVLHGCGGAPVARPEEGDEARVGPESLETMVREALDALDARTALYARHLPTGREVAVRADEPMNTLSVIKIPVLVQLYREADAGRLDLDARHEVRREELRRGSGLLQTFQPGLRPTLRDLGMQMIITSDNTATDILIERLGMDRVNAFLRSAGYRETAVRATTGDLFREVWVRLDAAHDTLTHGQVFDAGFPADAAATARSFAFEGDSTQWLGRTTAREMSRLLEQIYRADLASAEASAEMVGILRRQFYRSRLPRNVQYRGVAVGNKTGDWPPHAGSDVGILFHEGGPTIVSVFTGQNRGDFAHLEETIGRIAEMIVEAWGPAPAAD